MEHVYEKEEASAGAPAEVTFADTLPAAGGAVAAPGGGKLRRRRSRYYTLFGKTYKKDNTIVGLTFSFISNGLFFNFISLLIKSRRLLNVPSYK